MKWADLLPMAEFSHNSTTHSVTNQTPFSLMMGFEPQAYPLIRKTFFPALDKRLKILDAAHKEASATHAKATQAVKERIGMKFTPWKVEAKVWLDSQNLKINFPSRKLAPRREGPFKISQIIPPYTYHPAFLLPGRCMVSFMLHSFPPTRRPLSSAPTSFPSLVSSLMEKRSTRWRPSMPTKDPLADANT